MIPVLKLLYENELFSLLCLAAVLAFVGTKMVGNDSSARQWGWRLAAAGFVAGGVYGALTLHPSDADDWIHIVVRALVAGALLVGVSWIVLSVLAFLWKSLTGVAAARARARQAANARAREEEDRRRTLETQGQHADEEYNRRNHGRDQTAARAEAERRRNRARANAALTFSLCAPQLRERFTQQMFDDFLAKYMGDDQPPDEVERRGTELLQTLQKHVEATDVPEQKQTLEDLAHWFLQQKEHIGALPLDDKVKRVHVAELTCRYNELSTRLWKSCNRESRNLCPRRPRPTGQNKWLR
jgi:hypothetical protein